MSGFFDDKVVENKKGDEPWKKSETDRMLDLYFGATPPPRIARLLGRTPKSVERRLQQYTYNENGWAVKYLPRRRASRMGKKLTQNETVLIKAHLDRKVPPDATARLLQRAISEFFREESILTRQEARTLGVGVDLVLAYRYLHYCKGISIVSDFDYDALEKEEIEFGQNGQILKEKVGSDNPEDYPNHVRALGMYLAFKYAERTGGKQK